jgi:hypothetical protein
MEEGRAAEQELDYFVVVGRRSSVVALSGRRLSILTATRRVENNGWTSIPLKFYLY